MQAHQGHGKTGVFVGRQRELVAAMDRDLVSELQVLGIERPRVRCQTLALGFVEQGLRRELRQGDGVKGGRGGQSRKVGGVKT